jgi:hypothetical protein
MGLLLRTTDFWLEQHKDDKCEINSSKKVKQLFNTEI